MFIKFIVSELIKVSLTAIFYPMLIWACKKGVKNVIKDDC